MSRLPRSIRLCAALYRALIRILPGTVRARFGDEMTDTFIDLAFDAHERRGVPGVVGLTLRAVPQVLSAAFGMRRDGDVPDPTEERFHPRRAPLLDIAWQDLKIGVRSLRHRPGFSLSAVLILAISVGAATAIFSVLDGMVLRDIDAPEPERLVFFEQGSHTGPEYFAYQERMTTLDPLVAIQPGAADMVGLGDPERVSIARVSPEYFRALGVGVARGRLLDPGDLVGPQPVVVLAHRFWSSRFGAADEVIGQTVLLDGLPHEIVGVTSPDFRPPMRANSGVVDLWRPLDLAQPALMNPTATPFRLFGRMRDGASIEDVQREVDESIALAVGRYPEAYEMYGERGRFVPVTSLHAAEVLDLQTPLLALFGAVVLLLLVACATVASLVAVRLRARAPEIRIRAALGSPRRRIVSQLAAESLVLAVVGGLVGLALSAFGVSVLNAQLPVDLPGVGVPQVDARVFAFTLLAIVGAGFLFGWVPALLSSRGVRAATTRHHNEPASLAMRRLGRGLVAAEMALCVVLLVSAGLLVNSFRGLVTTDPGFQPEGALAFGVSLSDRYPERQDRDRYRTELLRTLAALPGVESAAMGLVTPFWEMGSCCRFGRVARADRTDSVSVTLHPVSSGFFETLGAELSEGADIPDVPSPGPMPVVLTRTTADRLYPGGGAVGQVVDLSHDRGYDGQVIGVVEDLPFFNVAQSPPTIFVPYHPSGSVNRTQIYVVRTRPGATMSGDLLRDAVWSVDAGLPVPRIVSLEDQVALSMLPSKGMALAVAAFAAFALLLALSATYGTVAYVVSGRKHEIGVRMALGAGPGRLIRYVVAGELRAATVGLVLGLVGGRLLSGVLAAEVFGVEPNDPAVFGLVVVGLIAAVTLATYLPARRVTRVALRDTLDAAERV